jgi:hypothetical protein
MIFKDEVLSLNIPTETPTCLAACWAGPFAGLPAALRKRTLEAAGTASSRN